METGNGTARAVRRAILVREHQSRAAGALDDARCEDADDAAMPASRLRAEVVEDKTGRKAAGCREQRFDLLFYLAQRVGFGGATVVIQAVKFLGKGTGRGWIA